MLDEKEIKDEVNADTQPASEEVSEQQEPIDENQEQKDVVEENMDSQSSEEQVSEEDTQEIQPRMFTQEEVNELIGKTRNEARTRANAAYYERYGVENDDELNDLVGRGQSYKVLEDNFNNQKTELENLKTDYALLKSGIKPERYEDVKLIIRGKGFEVNEATISQELATHPEWIDGYAQNNNSALQANPAVTTQEEIEPQTITPKKIFSKQMAEDIVNRPTQNPTPQTNNVVKKLGNAVPEAEDADDEAERVLKMFGI